MAEKDNDEKIDVFTEQFSKTEHFILNNKNQISTVVGVILVIVIGYVAYHKLVVAPKELEAQTQLFPSEQLFDKDSLLTKAINGDSAAPGFKAVAEKYGSTASGNLANFYLGASYLRTGKFEEALAALKKYDRSDPILGPIALGDMGDACLELGKKQEAVDYYLKAAKAEKNKFTTPLYLMKAGTAYEEDGKFDKAAEVYEQVQKEYFETPEGKDAAKFIARAKAATEKK